MSRPKKSRGKTNAINNSVEHPEDSMNVAQRLESTEKAIKNIEKNFTLQIEKLQGTIISLLNKNLETNTGLVEKSTDSDIRSTNENTIFNEENGRIQLIGGIPGPEKLTEELTIGQFKDWRQKFENYLLFQNLKADSKGQLTALLSTYFSQEISDIVRLVLKINDLKLVKTSEVLDKLEEYFKQKENGRILRSKFINRKQDEGETFSHFYREKLKLFQLTEPCSHCYDQCLTDHIIESLYDADLRRKCRTLPDTASVDDIRRLCENEETAAKEEQQYTKEILKIQQKSKTNKKCFRCNHPWHNNLGECPAKKFICKKCNIRGHFTEFCRTRNSTFNENATVGIVDINKVTYGHKLENSCKMRVKVNQIGNNKIIWYQAIADTGAEVTVAGEDFLKKMQISTNQLNHHNINLISGDSSTFRMLGYINCRIQYEYRDMEVRIYICQGFKNMLIDRQSLKNLGIIHKDFPKPLYTVTDKNILNINKVPDNPTDNEIEEIKSQLIQEYKDVFDTEKLKPMDGPPVNIHLKYDAIPSAITCPRKIPFAWRQQVKDELNQMVEKVLYNQ